MGLSIKRVKQKVFAYRIKSPLWAIASSILLVAAILVVLIHYGVHEQVLQLLKWFEAQGAWAPLLFIL
ncbi:MAG: hypothetical protein IMY82_04505, partial [Chloroflexi bacterium]|nr:hypothetical protein [Chloroflexota bacterium]